MDEWQNLTIVTSKGNVMMRVLPNVQLMVDESSPAKADAYGFSGAIFQLVLELIGSFFEQKAASSSAISWYSHSYWNLPLLAYFLSLETANEPFTLSSGMPNETIVIPSPGQVSIY